MAAPASQRPREGSRGPWGPSWAYGRAGPGLTSPDASFRPLSDYQNGSRPPKTGFEMHASPLPVLRGGCPARRFFFDGVHWTSPNAATGGASQQELGGPDP